MTRPEPAGVETAEMIAREYLGVTPAALFLRDAIAQAIAAAESRERERCAKIADVWANTKAELERSDNPTTARAIAAIISDTGQKIAERIRSSINPPGEEE